MSNIEEIWKDIPEYEGRYIVSNIGNIKSVKYYSKCSYSKNLKGRKTSKGYLRVQLCKNSKNKDFYIHRVVAVVFLPNPLGLKEVNHIDFDKSNNAISNLEWTTHAKNMAHAHKNGRVVFSDEVRKTISIKRKQYWKNLKAS